MFGRMRSRLGVESDAPAAPPAPQEKAKAPAKTEAKVEAPKPEPKQEEPSKQIETPATQEKPEKVETTGESKKVSPWKLVDQFKKKALEAEQRALELEKLVLPEDQRNAITERVTKAEQRAKELEDEIRYVNYAKSDEFKQKYQQPYERAWQRAMSELQGTTFQDTNGQQQTFDVPHMMELVQMPLKKAREMANSLFGDLANDVMNHRNGLKEMLDQQTAALDEARKTGAEREGQKRNEFQSFMAQNSAKAKADWESFNKEIQDHPEHGEFLKPKEGNDEWNSIIEKGVEFAKKAFSVNIMDPRMTPEQRREAVKQQAALYNKAVAYGPLRYEVKNLRKQLAEREAELKQYKETTPATGGSAPATGQLAAAANGRDGLFQRLRARAS